MRCPPFSTINITLSAPTINNQHKLANQQPTSVMDKGSHRHRHHLHLHRHHHHEEDEQPPPPPLFAGNAPPPHAYHTPHMGPGPVAYTPTPPLNSVYPPPPAVAPHPHMPYYPPITHQVFDELSNRPTVRMFCKAECNYSLAIRDGNVILARSNPSDLSQHWIRDEKLSTMVKDEEGFPSFALINKATGEAMKHSFGATHPVKLARYELNGSDDASVLWSQSKDLGDGYRAIRMVNNIRLNVDAFNGDKNRDGVHDGTKIVLGEWKRGDNQRWKIEPYTDKRTVVAN